jgi:hypothetical protein
MSDNDKRELLKLKQGLIDRRDCTEIEVDKPPIYEKPTGRAGVKNFFYHHKLHLSFAAFFLIVGVTLIYFTLSRDKIDITVLLISDTNETTAFLLTEQSAIKSAIEFFTPDFDNNGKVYAACLFIDLVTEGRRPDYVHGNYTKLFGEVRAGKAQIYIGNREALERIPLSGERAVEDFYDEFIKIKGTALEKIGEFNQSDLPEDLYIAIRTTADENSRIVWANIFADGHITDE